THLGDVHLVARDEAEVARAGAGGRRRQLQADEQFARLEDADPRRNAELLDRYVALALGTGDVGDGGEGDQGGSRVGGRAGVAEVAADRGAPLDRRPADDRGRVD